MSFENEQYVSSRVDRIEALEQEIARLKRQLESIKSPHNTIISSSEYAELLALNAELSDVTRKNHEFVLYVSELKQQLEKARELIEENYNLTKFTGENSLDWEKKAKAWLEVNK